MDVICDELGVSCMDILNLEFLSSPTVFVFEKFIQFEVF